jgi:hypothetical protein
MKIENPGRTDSNLVICKNCYIQFDLTFDLVFTQSSEHCKGHEFLIPEHAEIYKIDQPVYFIKIIPD